MPKHPKIANSVEAREFVRSASRTWRGATIRLSWAHERPGTGSCGGITVFEEEILEVQVTNCKVVGRRDGDGELTLTLYLEVDTDLYFAHGKIAHLVINKDDGTAIVHFHLIPGINQGPEEVRIERVE